MQISASHPRFPFPSLLVGDEHRIERENTTTGNCISTMSSECTAQGLFSISNSTSEEDKIWLNYLLNYGDGWNAWRLENYVVDREFIASTMLFPLLLGFFFVRDSFIRLYEFHEMIFKRMFWEVCSSVEDIFVRISQSLFTVRLCFSFPRFFSI